MGRVVNNINVKELDVGKKVSIVTLAIPRGNKNDDVDFVDCILLNDIAMRTESYVRKGDVVGIRGKLETNINADDTKVTEVVVDKISFLSSSK